jgi:hypothetical protein
VTHHAQAHAHDVGHGHSHGLVDPTIKRSREGLVAVGWSLLVLGLTALAQTAAFIASGSIALLADLIHNFGDAATAFPLAIAFALRSARAERWAGLAVVFAIFVSACVAGYESVLRLVDPREPEHSRRWRRRASSGSRATGSPPSSAPAPAGASTARHYSPTEPTRAPTPTSASRLSRAPPSSLSDSRSPIR